MTIQKKAKIELKDRDMVQITGRSCCHALTKGLEHLLNCSLHAACLKHQAVLLEMMMRPTLCTEYKSDDGDDVVDRR